MVAYPLETVKIVLLFLVHGTLDVNKADVPVCPRITNYNDALLNITSSVYTCAGGFKLALDGKSCIAI